MTAVNKSVVRREQGVKAAKESEIINALIV